MKLKRILRNISLILFMISLWLILKHCNSESYVVFGFSVLVYIFTVSEEYIIKGFNNLYKNKKSC